MQARGVLHYHLLVDYRPGRERARIDEYVRQLKELAPRYMFGFVDISRRFDGAGGARAAGYCAKYIGKATSETMVEGRPMYVGQHLTSKTGVTMRFCRFKRYVWYLTRGLDLDTEETARVMLDNPDLDLVGAIERRPVLLPQPPPHSLPRRESAAAQAALAG